MFATLADSSGKERVLFHQGFVLSILNEDNYDPGLTGGVSLFISSP